MTNYHSDDRPDPAEQPIRARVPDHVTGGAFSTGVIVMTAQTEFILDFVQNLGRPHQIVSRVVMPHNVLPQLVDALHRNMERYRSRWGELPQTPGQIPAPAAGPGSPPQPGSTDAGQPRPAAPGQSVPAADAPAVQQPAPASLGGNPGGEAPPTPPGQPNSGPSNSAANQPPPGLPPAGSGARQASAQEIYDDLKIRDE